MHVDSTKWILLCLTDYRTMIRHVFAYRHISLDFHCFSFLCYLPLLKNEANGSYVQCTIARVVRQRESLIERPLAVDLEYFLFMHFIAMLCCFEIMNILIKRTESIHCFLNRLQPWFSTAVRKSFLSGTRRVLWVISLCHTRDRRASAWEAVVYMSLNGVFLLPIGVAE